MGFLDVDKCKQALVATNGDIGAAIDELVGGVLGPGVPDACFLRLYLSRCSYLLYNICNGLIFFIDYIFKCAGGSRRRLLEQIEGVWVFRGIAKRSGWCVTVHRELVYGQPFCAHACASSCEVVL